MVAGHLEVKKGYYYAVLSYIDEQGKRQRPWVATGLPEKGNKRKAESALANIRNTYVPPVRVRELSSDMPFADYLEQWLEIAKVRIKLTTYRSYSQLVKGSIAPYFREKNISLQKLEARHLQSFYSKMLKSVSANTVIHYHAILHSVLKYAVKTDMLMQNVADKVDRPKKNSYEPVFLSTEELQKLFDVVRGTKYELPVLVGAFYGFRRGEVLGLKWDAIDLERGTITVKHTVTNIILDGKSIEYAQDSAKTKSSLRTLPLVGNFRQYFEQVKEAQAINKKVCGNCYSTDYEGYVFVDEMDS